MPVPAENIMRLLPDAEPPSREQLARYFEACADACLEHLGSRFLTLVRHVDGTTFFHKGPLPPVPPTVHQETITKADGTAGVRVWVDDLAGLLGLVEMDVVELHPWGATVDDIERPDRLILDLDPDEGMPWSAVTSAAIELRDFLAARRFATWPKTTGGKGLHLVVPVERSMLWKEASAFARTLAQDFADRDDSRFTAKAGAKARSGGKIFIDHLRNGRGTTALGAMSPRARAGGLVSTPITWAEVHEGVSPAPFTLAAVQRRIAIGVQPWEIGRPGFGPDR